MPNNRIPAQRRGRLVRKASVKNGDWVALYDQNGQLLGICDPANITPVSNADGSTSVPAATAPGGKQAAGEDPETGIAKRMAEVRKGLYGGVTAQDQVELSDALNRAAIVGLDIIHGRRPIR